MKRRFASLVVVLAFTALSTQAMAADHIWKVSEVMLSTGGDGSAQFVEFSDIAEPNASQPYRLEVYDTDATVVGSLDLPGVVSGTLIYYVSTATADAALGTTADTVLNISLPEVGQICFVRSTGTRVHCVAWGCVNTLVVPNAARAPTPNDGESTQRQSDGTYELASPTGNAPNLAGTEALACATDAPDAGTGGGDGDGDGGGCSTTTVSGRTAGGGLLLVLMVLVALRRPRQR